MAAIECEWVQRCWANEVRLCLAIHTQVQHLRPILCNRGVGRFDEHCERIFERCPTLVPVPPALDNPLCLAICDEPHRRALVCIPLGDAHEPGLKVNFLPGCAWFLVESAPIDDNAQVRHIFGLELVPSLLERCDEKLQSLALRIGMLVHSPQVRYCDHRQRTVSAA